MHAPLRRRPLALFSSFLFSSFLVGACVFEGTATEPLDESRQAERWNAANDPTAIDPTFEIRAAALPLAGETERVPIASDYWPTYADSINRRWDGPGSLSPAEKWERAFDRPGAALAVSETDGIRAQVRRKECSAADRSCSDLDDGSTCGIPRGETVGRCIPTWWGLCHGWAPFAIRHAPPTRPVTRNGVVFYPGDLEALGSIVYAHGLPTAFLSQRCNVREPASDDSGRMIATACRDMNPGTFHVLVANRLGLQGQSFVYDKNAADQVWNQPVHAFRVINADGGRLTAITRAAAVALVGATRAGAAYVYNPDARGFFHVKMELTYVTEASPARTSHADDIERYLAVDRLEYVLETDSGGRVLGGEWVGASRTSHPDFAWWPTGDPRGVVARGLITYAEVKELLDESAGL